MHLKLLESTIEYEPTIVDWGYMGIMEAKMETATV